MCLKRMFISPYSSISAHVRSRNERLLIVASLHARLAPSAENALYWVLNVFPSFISISHC